MKKLPHSAIVIFVALLTSLVLCGCTDETEEMTVTVYGTVFMDSNPLQGATVSVARVEPGEGSVVVGKVVTGSDGTYEMSFTVNSNISKKEGSILAMPPGWTSYTTESGCRSDFSYYNATKVRIDFNIRSRN